VNLSISIILALATWLSLNKREAAPPEVSRLLISKRMPGDVDPFDAFDAARDATRPCSGVATKTYKVATVFAR
jgi:hypothetical protein